jgi:protein tyrosine/serine phosphatase
MQKPSARNWLPLLLSLGLGLLAALTVYAAGTVYEANFHTVLAGELYRSGQMGPDQLARAVQEYGIKSILNLRGSDPATWYQQEMAMAGQLGVRHYDFKLSATEEVSLSNMYEIVRLLQTAPKPVLIHCKAGSDRTGLVAALYCLAISRETPETADRQLTLWYGHFPACQSVAMDHSYWNYVSNQMARVTASASSPAVATQAP